MRLAPIRLATVLEPTPTAARLVRPATLRAQATVQRAAEVVLTAKLLCVQSQLLVATSRLHRHFVREVRAVQRR